MRNTKPLAIVSGGTRGIGRQISLRLAQIGYRVIALYGFDRLNAKSLEKVAVEQKFDIVTEQVDLKNAKEVNEVQHKIENQFGIPEILVNNAGINVDRPFLKMTIEDWDKVIQTNLSGVFYLTRAFAPMMMERSDTSHIINIGATTGIRARLNGINYCASKAGLLSMTKCLAMELAPKIRVNCLIPGMIETEELVERFHLDDPQTRSEVLSQIPLAELGTISQVADALVFLCSPEAKYMTGQKLIIDGGQFMW